MKKGVGRLTPIQKRRAMTWMRRGFTAHQARMFAEFPLTRHYMVRFYQTLQMTPNVRAMSDTKLWGLFRREYSISVGLGKYDPPPSKYSSSGKPHRKILPDGSVDRSHARAYERGRRASTRPQAQPMDTERWKSDLRRSIENTRDPARKAQLKQQLENLGG